MNRKRFFCEKCGKNTYHAVLSILVPNGKSHEWYQAFYRCDECGVLTRVPIIRYEVRREPANEFESKVASIAVGTARESFPAARKAFGNLTYRDLENILKRGVGAGLLREVVSYAPLEKATPTGKCPACGSPTISLYASSRGSKKKVLWFCTVCGASGPA